MKLGEKIKFARERAGMTQAELGKTCETTKQTIYKYETGVVTNIPLDRLQQMADALGVSSAYLMGWEEETSDEPLLTEEEIELVDLFRLIPKDAQQTILHKLRAYADSLK